MNYIISRYSTSRCAPWTAYKSPIFALTRPILRKKANLKTAVELGVGKL